MSELRYHPFLGQWVTTATHRQHRTFHPETDFCPLCPTKAGGYATEVPAESYEIAVFENQFPSYQDPPSTCSLETSLLIPIRPSTGVCEVVCYTDQHDGSFSSLSPERVAMLTRVWKERYCALRERVDVEYALVFENKGAELGVTLSHPHGQIYGYPFLPPIPERMLAMERAYLGETERPLMQDWLLYELDSRRRVVFENDRFAAIVPVFARFPYEVWVTPKSRERSLADCDETTLDDLADALLQTTRLYDRLFKFSLPYLMAIYQEPCIPGYEFTWMHVEFAPFHRTQDRLKYLASSETLAGAFINDALAEESASQLRLGSFEV